MTPKEKAKQLFKKYSKGKDEHGWSLCEFDSCAKKCALIAVDEILKSVPKQPSISITMPHFEATVYWEEVKNEINKL